MHKRPHNALQTAAQWGGRAINPVGLFALVYDLLVAMARVAVPPGKTRRKVARKLQCDVGLVPHMVVWYAAIYELAGLIFLLCLCVLKVICFD